MSAVEGQEHLSEGTSGVMHAELAEMQRRRFAPESVDRHEDLFHHMARTLSIKHFSRSSIYRTPNHDLIARQRSRNSFAGTTPEK